MAVTAETALSGFAYAETRGNAVKTSSISRLACWCAVLVLSITAGFAQETPPTALSLTDRVFFASRIYASLDSFAQWQNAPDVNLDAAYRSYLEKAIAAQDREAFDRATMEFLAGFHNAHTVMIDMPLMQQAGPLPIVAESVGGKWVVTESWVAGLKPGDVIEDLDGRPFDEFVRDSLRMVSGSTDAGQRRLLFSRLGPLVPYADLFPGKFVVTLADGRSVPVDRHALEPVAPLQTEGRWLDQGKVAYIRIPSFMGADLEKRALELAQEYRGASLLIVDVRNNAGGSTPWQLTAFLMDRPYRWWTEAIPMNVPFFRFRAAQGGHEDYRLFDHAQITWAGTPQQPAKDHFAGKLALLVDAGCMSACEDFAMQFKDNHRATLFGERTAGSSGEPYQLNFGNGILVLIGAKREAFPDGSQFEGVGIKPDVEISPTVSDLSAGKDVVLESARRQLGQ